MNRPIPDGLYVLVHAASRKVLDVPGGGWDNGAPVSVWERLGPQGSPGQQWTVAFDPALATYTLRRPDAEKFLDVVGGSREGGAAVQVWEGTHSDAQRWRFEPRGEAGRFALVNAGSGLLLTVAEDAGDGAAVQQSREVPGSGGQQWEPVAVG
ncbi:RICIN domain-containing protein [Streptomyces sp. TS71-3]|uniref:RICIN domain-containing protein n=1 Tax=Streptomyces sp. TS71-3 TaxID=2733862 RepID=UPI001B0350FD|nr:RICIN domain-containing protein [Streptomyces sp. TS71-3]GHJ37815.1 hypothetical protein Sm713_34240 [Streptomyces sp. TS71-3]